jgi:hypothetical protein|tara:strand:+ start:188 stop:454 length:267 start_codon:yes stop_codon:yes gene_type:complete
MTDTIRKPIFISINPTDEGYECNVLPPTDMPKVENFAVALTMAYGMVKATIDDPNLIFEYGIDAMHEQKDTHNISFDEILKRRKERLN